MLNKSEDVITNILTLLIVVILSIHYATARHNEYRNYTHRLNKEGRQFKNFLHSNLIETIVSDVDDLPSETYNVTFTDINNQEVLVIFNRNLINEWIYDEDLTFSERAREDAYVKTSPAEYPHSVLMFGMINKQPVNFCSGTLLTPQWVLTAAQCTQTDPKLDAVIIYAGGNGMRDLLNGGQAEGSQLAVSREFFAHPHYYFGHADISIIKVGPFNLSGTVNIVSLSSDPWSFYSYKDCKFTGYGTVRLNEESKDDKERKTHNLFVKNPCICSFMLKSLLGRPSTKQIICTKPMEDYGFCAGDSGGGLICDGEMKGVAMLIVQLRDKDNCDIALSPPGGIKCGSVDTLSLFTDICPYLPWINNYTNLFDETEISPECYDRFMESIATNNSSYILLLFVILQFQLYFHSV